MLFVFVLFATPVVGCSIIVCLLAIWRGWAKPWQLLVAALLGALLGVLIIDLLASERVARFALSATHTDVAVGYVPSWPASPSWRRFAAVLILALVGYTFVTAARAVVRKLRAPRASGTVAA